MREQNQAPEGATHYHPGNEIFKPHYLRVEEGQKPKTWITGFVTGDCWSDIPKPDLAENYQAL